MSYLIKDLPEEEKPREKAKKYGFSSLSDSELLAILLRTGTKECSVIDLSRNILKEFGTIEGLLDARITSLQNILGMGEVKAITLLASLELARRIKASDQKAKRQIKESKDVYEYFVGDFFHSDQEKFYALFLDSKNYILATKLLFVGTINQSFVHPRDIFKEALLNNAVKIICVHNHPSGDVTPSAADIEVTKKLKKIGDLMNIPVIDHVIIGKDKYYSFLERNGEIFA